MSAAENSSIPSGQRYIDFEISTEIMTKAYMIWIVLGISGNLMTLLVTTLKNNRKISTCIYMSAISVMDTMVLLSIAMYTISFIFGDGYYWSNDVIRCICL